MPPKVISPVPIPEQTGEGDSTADALLGGFELGKALGTKFLSKEPVKQSPPRGDALRAPQAGKSSSTPAFKKPAAGVLIRKPRDA